MDHMDHMDLMDAVMLKSPFCPSGPPGPSNAGLWQKHAEQYKEFILQNLRQYNIFDPDDI